MQTAIYRVLSTVDICCLPLQLAVSDALYEFTRLGRPRRRSGSSHGGLGLLLEEDSGSQQHSRPGLGSRTQSIASSCRTSVHQ